MTVLFVLVFVMFVLTTAALTVNMFAQMIVFVCMFHKLLLSDYASHGCGVKAKRGGGALGIVAPPEGVPLAVWSDSESAESPTVQCTETPNF